MMTVKYYVLYLVIFKYHLIHDKFYEEDCENVKT